MDHPISLFTGFYVQPNVISFISHPQNQLAVLNSTVTFQCAINKTSIDDSLPNITITWVHNSNSSTNSSCSRIVSYDNSSVILSECIIESVQLAQEGFYQCNVIDGMDQSLCVNLPCIETATASSSAQLKVISK